MLHLKKLLSLLALLISFGMIQAQCFDSELYNTPGVHTFTVPSTGTIKISASGADGGGTNGGNGANLGAQFDVTQGDVLTIVVGEAGETCECNTNTGAGGGGTSIILNNTEVLLVAGGGGGAGLGEGGKNALGAVTTPPCTGGVDCGGLGSRGGGGGGFDNAGGIGNLSPPAGGGGAGTLSNNGAGGDPSSQTCPTSGLGGDGWGGGGAAACGSSGGGGGGYKGGRGASVSGGRGGWGGESFRNEAVNNGASASPSITSSTDDGLVQIECLSAAAPVPTMGEWALIIFALIIMSIGVVTVMRWQTEKQVEVAE